MEGNSRARGHVLWKFSIRLLLDMFEFEISPDRTGLEPAVITGLALCPRSDPNTLDIQLNLQQSHVWPRSDPNTFDIPLLN